MRDLPPHQRFHLLERSLALFAGLFNVVVGGAFFFTPELHVQLWPEYGVSDIMARYIGSIILGNAVGAFCLASQTTWAAARALVLVATTYGTLVAASLTYHLVACDAAPAFWIFVGVDLGFLVVFYIVLVYHELLPRWRARRIEMLAR